MADDRRALDVLAGGEVTVKGRIRWSSNATYLVEVALGDDRALAVYKPVRGERPLWDFPPDLYRREVAAYLLSEALGWGLVPPTVARDGPHGEGSLQLFVDADFERHYFTLREEPAHRERLARICAFDLVANNADRKAGHCLFARDGTIWAIDNALTFHVEPKVRTVIWDFAGEPIPAALVADLDALIRRGVPPELAALLADDERRALVRRMRGLVKTARFPADPGGRSYPWPLV
ncbi:MAG: SCO1664 family protein [Candidatus Rokubacteria bacterium]|nr:SCO1664 family protein [Candidatus Rokubacteria bacterium]